VRSDDGQFQHFVLKYENGVWTDDGSGKKGASVDMLLGTIWPNMALTNKGLLGSRASAAFKWVFVPSAIHTMV
jgi:hypothetical protein